MATKEINTGDITIAGNRNISNTGTIAGNYIVAETVINIHLNQLSLGENVAEIKLQAFLNRFENVLIGLKDVARIHSVSPRTITNYINNGLIVPEVKVNENEQSKFRLSYALTLDFRQLQTELKAKRKGELSTINTTFC